MAPKSLRVTLPNLIKQNQTPKTGVLSIFRAALYFFCLEEKGQQPCGPNYHQWNYDGERVGKKVNERGREIKVS